MQLLLEFIFLVSGVVLMLWGADLLLAKAKKLGQILHWSPVMIGVAIVAIGTSLPEFIVSILAASQGYPLLAAGNIVGSNITNIGLIVGLAALLSEIKLSKKTVDYDIPLSIAPVGVFVFGYIFHSTITALIGLLLLFAYVGYLGITAKEYEKQVEPAVSHGRLKKIDIAILVFSIVMLVGGGEITIRMAEAFFTHIGVSDVIVGAVLLALGTSLPELIATLTAIIRKEGQIAVGNVLGSNVFNILGALGVASIIAPLELSKLVVEIIFLGIVSAVFLLVAKTGKKYSISRREGAILLIIYVLYVGTVTFIAH